MTSEQIELALREIATSGVAGPIKGTSVDKFTANLILTVADRLNENNKKSLLDSSVESMVAISYRMVTH